MKHTTPCTFRWRIRALLCGAAGILLAGCGAGNQGGLSNGPQMAAVAVASAVPAVQAASEAAALDPAPEPAPASLSAPPAPQSAYQAPVQAATASDSAPGSTAPATGAKADAFALTGYGASQSAGSNDAGTVAAAGDNTMPAEPAQAASPAICKYGGCSFH